jgi:hypothetical protein
MGKSNCWFSEDTHEYNVTLCRPFLDLTFVAHMGVNLGDRSSAIVYGIYVLLLPVYN